MQVRLIGDPSQLTYNGIRDPGKLKEFILTDVLTFFVHRRVSNLFHSKGGDDDRRNKFREMSISISRSLALDYHGDNVGTPADQISKRIANIVDLMDGIEQRNKAPSTLVTEEQIRILRSMIGGSGNTVSVKLSPPLNTECGMLAIGESKTHACLEEVCRHIIDNILVPSRGEIRLQAVIRQQYEVGYHVLGDIKGLDENLMLDCVRMYMAMRCVLHAPFQSVGDVYEPSLEEGSFMELLPRMPKPVKFVDPIIVSIGGYADITLKFHAEEAPEGVLRIRDEMIKILP